MEVQYRFKKNVPFGDLPWEISQLCRFVTCSAGVRPKGCREIALVSFGRAAWPEAMQSAHARALLPALPWQLMRVTAGSRLVRSEVNMDWMLMPFTVGSSLQFAYCWAGTIPSAARREQVLVLGVGEGRGGLGLAGMGWAWLSWAGLRRSPSCLF